MDAETRRKNILELLKQSSEPITGSELAQRFSVSRQVIVQDIAILRAAGQTIIATPQGYLIPDVFAQNKLTRTFACRHTEDKLERELQIMVDCGGKVLDVIVEHPLYGELKGMLMLDSRSDIEEFLYNFRQSKARLLSALTYGIHLHTVEAPSVEVFERIEEALAEEGILLNRIEDNFS
ncbi:transcription repressor NadR [Calderihabitans maritimus]|uniref:3H domain-containing protein n=1 Tax=Calderihabitans maritimus TaxID=1246530 RepID=A0A1Z5HRR9_9FIRM|nr:transcription repressor NadR [Calderihabitans maritimus]GAW92222.1 3H domain-containing protein [Calderihabitans maritimus]